MSISLIPCIISSVPASQHPKPPRRESFFAANFLKCSFSAEQSCESAPAAPVLAGKKFRSCRINFHRLNKLINCAFIIRHGTKEWFSSVRQINPRTTGTFLLAVAFIFFIRKKRKLKVGECSRCEHEENCKNITYFSWENIFRLRRNFCFYFELSDFFLI